jgi:hypothetical protein
MKRISSRERRWCGLLVVVTGTATGLRIQYESMSSVPTPKPSPVPDWSRLVADSVKQYGLWHTYQKLAEARIAYPGDLSLRGYTEIVRNTIVRELLSGPRGLQAVPRLTAEFLTNFDRFNLNAQEGYLISLIDGRLDLQKLLILSPFDPFTTLFNVAKLQYERAVMVPQ